MFLNLKNRLTSNRTKNENIILILIALPYTTNDFLDSSKKYEFGEILGRKVNFSCQK